MGKLFNSNSPIMRFLTMVSNLLWLNILTIIFCVPIITAGASLTASYYCALKLVRGEEGYISSDFFRSFKRNFKQATIIFIPMLLLVTLLAFDVWYVFLSGLTANLLLKVALVVALVFILTGLSMIYPVLSHFDNTIKNTVKNAFIMGFLQLPKTILMILVKAVPGVILYITPQIAPLSILFWFSFPTYIAALLVNNTFKKFEPIEEVEDPDFSWSVPGDEDGDEGNVNE